MKWLISGHKGGTPGRWALDASSEESARQKAERAGVVIEQIEADIRPIDSSSDTAAGAELAAPTVAEPACANCGRTKGRLEQLYEWGEHAVCLPCYNFLAASVQAGPAPDPEPAVYFPPSPPTLSYAAQTRQPRAQTIEQTGKFWKSQLLLSALLSIAGVCVIGFSVQGNQSSEVGVGTGTAMLIIGIAWFIVARIGAWWFHG